MKPKQYGHRERMPGTMFGYRTVKHRVLPPRPTEVIQADNLARASALIGGLERLPKAGLEGPPGPAGPPGFSHEDAVVLEAAWLDLKDAILTPRNRRVIRDEYGQIVGLTDG